MDEPADSPDSESLDPALARAAALHPQRVDRVLHDPVRMAMAAVLATTSSVTFTDMKRRLGLTDGNLSVHARRLENVGYISVVKHVRHRTTRTEYRLSPAGRRALARYLAALQAFVDAVRAATRPPDPA